MHKTWAVVKREFGAFVGTKSFVLGTLFGPFALLLLFLLPELIEGGAGDARQVVVEPGGTPASQDVAAALGRESQAADATALRIEVVESSAAGEAVLQDLRERILAGRLDGFLILPADSAGAVVYEGRPADLQAMGRLRAAAERAVQRARLAAAGIDAGAVERALAPVRFETHAIGSAPVPIEPREDLVGFVFFLNTLIYIVILIYGISVLRSVQEEKEQRIVEVLLSSLRPGQLMTGKVLGIGAAGLLQVVIWVAFAAVVLAWGDDLLPRLGMTPPSIPRVPASLALVVLVFFAGGYFLYAALYAALGAIATSWQDAQNLQFPALIVLMVAYFTTFAAAENPDSGLAAATSLIPFTSPLVVPARVALGAMGWGELVLPLVLLAAGCAALLWIAGRIFRVTILATGARPTPRRLWQWFRAT
jgi:ABC-2 type transport system permease protein